MAARTTTQEEERDLQEASTLCLIPTANLEAAGSVELEEEEEGEEDEEAAAARRARSFARDARVRFLGSRLERLLGFPQQQWSRYLESEDHRQLLAEFLESGGPAYLVFSADAAGGTGLAASREVRMQRTCQAARSASGGRTRGCCFALEVAFLQAQPLPTGRRSTLSRLPRPPNVPC